MADFKLSMNPKNKLDGPSRVSWQQARVLEMQAEHADAFDTSAGTYEQMRASYREERKMWNSGGPVMAQTVELKVPCGDHEVGARLLRPVEDGVLPVLFYIHGGGMVVGDNDTHSLAQRKLAAYSGCAVVGIDYSLSPEAKYPLPVEECVAVVKYVTEHAAEYQLDPERIGFSGDSGGGNLSMGSILALRDQGFDTSKIKAAVLYYGGYGLGGHCVAGFLHGGAWDGMTEADLDYYNKMYLGDQDPNDCPYYNIYVNDLTWGIPPCFIVAAELDPLRDDNRLLYEVLTDKGVHCEYHEYKGALHAFIHYSKVMDDAEDALRRGAHFFAHECGLDPRN